MSLMNPILRIRRVIRTIGATNDQADEFADAMDVYPTRREFEMRMEAMYQRHFKEVLIAMIAVVGLGVAILALLIVLFA